MKTAVIAFFIITLLSAGASSPEPETVSVSPVERAGDSLQRKVIEDTYLLERKLNIDTSNYTSL